jgi:hypothetical protein
VALLEHEIYGELAAVSMEVASLHHRSGRLVFCRRRSPLSDAPEIVVNDTQKRRTGAAMRSQYKRTA